MTKLIDGDRLEAWLQDQGGIDALLIQLVLDDFIYQPPQTPKSKIKKSVKELVRRRDPGSRRQHHDQPEVIACRGTEFFYEQLDDDGTRRSAAGL